METHWSSISIPGALDVPEVFMDDVLLYDVPEIFIPEIFIDDVLLYFRGLGTVALLEIGCMQTFSYINYLNSCRYHR